MTDEKYYGPDHKEWGKERSLRKCVQRLFEILDTTEVSDSGHEFHPVRFSSVRLHLSAECNYLFKQMKKLSKYESPDKQS